MRHHRLLVLSLTLSLGACTAPTTGLDLSLTESKDRLAVFVGGQLFTSYLFKGEQKYPYFYPVNGPASGRSVTTESSQPYPHHHSLFFACDRVNGGNYWQEGLERGQIHQRSLQVEQHSGKQVAFVTENLWQRPGAKAPFLDRRRVVIRAPDETLRLIDFTITLTALQDVRIQNTNHALFAARVRKDLSVKAGGTLVNAAAERGEKATFGQVSPWMDCSGQGEGLAILVHPTSAWAPVRWFTRDYGFFSPTPMHWLQDGHLDIPQGASRTLKYRVIVHTGDATEADIEALYRDYRDDKGAK